MEIGDIRIYKERWKAVEEIERWNIINRRYRFIEHILIILGIKADEDVEKMQITLRWLKIKEAFGQGKLKVPNVGN